MQRIYVPNQSKQTIGGGHSFLRNFHKAMGDYFEDVVFVDNVKDADITFIVSSTLQSPGDIDGSKKIVLRVDNIPKNSRNRNTGTSRLKRFAELADVVVFQSHWAESYCNPLVGNKKRHIIYNAVDQDVFYPPKSKVQNYDNRYLYVQYNRDENKRYPEAFYYFHVTSIFEPNSELWVLGNFSPEQIEYNFDFWNGEKVRYIPATNNPDEVANAMRCSKYLYFPAFMDACPNTVIEALSCGQEVLGVHDVGGTKEVIKIAQDTGIRYFGLKRMAEQYHDLFKSL